MLPLSAEESLTASMGFILMDPMISVYKSEEQSPRSFDLLDTESWNESLDPLPRTRTQTQTQTESQSPPVDIMTPPQHRSRQQEHINQPIFNSADNDIPRPAQEASRFSAKMLALPTLSIRPFDINTQREAGHMGINPITLRGEMGLLPGRLGEGKEFANAMSWLTPIERSSHCQQTPSMRPQLPQYESNGAIIDMKELHLQYAQAILNGDVIVESFVDADSPPHSLIAQSLLAASLPQKCSTHDGHEEDWVDMSDEEESAVEEKSGSGHKREDSGYSSAEASYRKKIAQGKRPDAKRRKTVRFDDEATEEQKEETNMGRIGSVE